MGIYGALATAVTGLRAQSFALENISGNIANSQTTAYKRIETTFIDLIPEAPLKSQVPGAVIANSRATNTDGGDVVSAGSETYMALNGGGFFVVEKRIGINDGNSVFNGANYYTRRGDFDVDREGYLVNGAGYYLKGFSIDPATGNISGSVPQVIQLSNDFLAAQQTNRIDYRLNLPQVPRNSGFDTTIPNSELMTPSLYANAGPFTNSARITGTVNTITGAAVPNTILANGQTLSVTVGGVTRTYGFNDTGAAVPGANVSIDTNLAPNDSMTGILNTIQADLQGLGGGFATATVALTGSPGSVQITLGANITDTLTIGGTGGPTSLGLATTANYAHWNTPPTTIQAQNNANFLADSIAGGAITVYASNGSPVNVQLRWAKMDSPGIGGTDRWNLFYLEDSAATGTQPMWRNAGVNYDFLPTGVMNPSITTTNIPAMTVNGVNVGAVAIQHNTGGVTQFADANGTAQVTLLSQNGYPPGEFISVTVNEQGRVVASYTNGQSIDLAQVVVAQFSAPNSLKREDGGLFSATSESGEAILDSAGSILGGSLESSNTDISEEFTKLIVTQQAYAAGTRIVTTSNQMLQEVLNMLR